MPSYFEQLKTELPTLKAVAQTSGANGFFAQETLRFYSVAGTLLEVDGFKLDETAANDERYITHILLRSLLENYFTIIYLFDAPARTATRYDELKNSFTKEYLKLMNDLNGPTWQTFMQAYQAQLEPANTTWNTSPVLPDVNTMLTGLRNDYGDRLNYLYPFYRITSFDTHGRSLETIFEAVFDKTCHFPVLKIRRAIELIANQYLVVLNELRRQGGIT